MTELVLLVPFWFGGLGVWVHGSGIPIARSEAPIRIEGYKSQTREAMLQTLSALGYSSGKAFARPAPTESSPSPREAVSEGTTPAGTG